jgi:uncharacterized membrane protein YoaK (UPF0700 family)
MLAACAGSADAWAYLGLGHAFVANMTGNTVLLGMSVFSVHGDALHPLTSVICYVLGVITGSLFARKAQPEQEGRAWPVQISGTLLLEAVLLLCSAAAWFLSHPSGSFHPDHTILLGIVAFAIGMQSAAMVQLKIPGIVTTYITGTWTTLMTGLTRLEKQPPAEKQKLESRLGMQVAVLAVYFLSAVLAGWLFRYIPAAVGAVPTLSVLLVAIYGLIKS